MKNNKRIGVALSGGGYRAAAYHIGTLRALDKLGILKDVDVISSVSGGSILAAYYALHKDNYEEFEAGFIKRLQKGVVNSSFRYGILVLIVIFLIAATTSFLLYLMGVYSVICVSAGFAVLLGLIVIVLLKSFKVLPISQKVSEQYDKVFFSEKTLGDLPDKPILNINATNIATQQIFSFSKNYMGEYGYMLSKDKSLFDATHYPIANAVMASSCVPYGFTPITIGKEFIKGKLSDCRAKEMPMLIDGGVYDNQGAHKLTQKKSKYHCDYIIVSDAGNSIITAKGTKNIITLAINTINMMMSRIKRIQRYENLYQQRNDQEHFAYVPLEWDCKEDGLLGGFVRNLQAGNIHEDIYQAHGISDEDIKMLRSEDKNKHDEALHVIMGKLETSIGWDTLSKKTPSIKQVEIARSVDTNLTALKTDKISALIAHSEWLAEVQVRMYLPMIS